MIRSFSILWILTAATGAAAGLPPWRDLPAFFWAFQAAVPPATTEKRSTQTVVPEAPKKNEAPTKNGAVQLAPGITVPVATPAPGGAPPTGSSPLGPAGQFQTLPGSAPAGSGAPVDPAKPGSPNPAAAAPGVPPADRRRPVCEVYLRLARTELPPEGGEFSLPASLKPAACATPIAFSASWLKVINPATLKFAVEANDTAMIRDAVLQVGGRSFYIQQPPPAQPGLAVVPGRLVFGVDKQGRSARKTLTAWSERAEGEISVQPQHPWLIVTQKRGQAARHVYEVSIRAGAALPSGRHDTSIELSAGGPSGRSVTIPVVVEVTGKP